MISIYTNKDVYISTFLTNYYSYYYATIVLFFPPKKYFCKNNFVGLSSLQQNHAALRTMTDKFSLIYFGSFYIVLRQPTAPARRPAALPPPND